MFVKKRQKSRSMIIPRAERNELDYSVLQDGNLPRQDAANSSAGSKTTNDRP